MSIAARLPSMTLPELTRLRDNAVRLASGAPGKPRDQATALLPLLDAQIAARRDGKKRVTETPAGESGAARPKPRAPKLARPPKPVKSESAKADDFLAGVNEALARR